MDKPQNFSKELNRREFGGRALGAFVGIAFLQSLLTACGADGTALGNTSQVVAQKVEPIIRHWAIGLNELCSDLRASSISARAWQEKIEELLGKVELEELLAFIDFKKLSAALEHPDLGVGTQTVVFPALEGLPEKTVFVKKIFGMKKGRAIVPHGHSNMASAHLILKGSFHLRHYEKIAIEDGYLRIRPTIDTQAGAGDSSSISDERDNVHWFIANTDEAYTFDVIMLDLEGRPYDIHNLDIDGATKSGGGELLVPKIDVDTALKKYGKQHHGPLA